MSVVIATHRRAGLLAGLVAALEDQGVDGGFEVIVVDDGSDDATPAELARLVAASTLDMAVVRIERAGGPAAARNLGWRRARGDVIAFTDDDCQPAPGWLEALTAPIRAGGADLAQGVTEPERPKWEGSGPFARTMWVLDEDGFYATCNMAYRRSVLEAAGGFDERFRRPFGEDTDLAWRVIENGGRPRFVPGAVVHHEVWPSRYSAYLRDRVRREGIVLAARLHPQLRRRFFRPHWYQASHPRAALATVGALLAAGVGWVVGGAVGGAVGVVVLAGGVAPYVHYRLAVRRLPCRTRNLVPVLALALLADLVEIGVLGLASVRYRTLLL